LIPLFLLVGCSEYQVHRLDPPEEKNWFDDARIDTPDGEESDEDPTSDGEEDDEDSWRDEDREDDESHDEDDSDDSDDSDDDGDYWGDEDEDEDDDGGSGSGGGSGGSGSGPGDSSSTARDPYMGEIVISELMIDPDSVDDQDGEWIELHNITGDWLDLTGHRLADGDLDDMEIDPTGSGSLVVQPGGYLVICAVDDYWDNGGVRCDGTFRWWTFGGGFAMSNTEDEVLVRDPFGGILDRVRWVEGFAEVGGAMGLDPDEHSISRNDDLDHWCDQWSWLPFGDSGTPGEDNDTCW
jgi:hypothetical protein